MKSYLHRLKYTYMTASMRRPMFFILMLVVVAVTAKRGRKTEKPAETTIEILSKGNDSVHARFRPALRKKNYFVSISIYLLADVPSVKTMTLRKKNIKSDGFHHIAMNGGLQPGITYEIYISMGKEHLRVGSTTFFTDCDDFTHQCYSTGYRRDVCLEKNALCNGVSDCDDGSDEVLTSDGCKVKLPDRPIPPPPPSDTHCVMARNRAGRGDSKQCEEDGTYSPMHCVYTDESNVCHCINKDNGEILHTIKNYHPFVNDGFRELCEKMRQTNSSPPLPPPDH